MKEPRPSAPAVAALGVLVASVVLVALDRLDAHLSGVEAGLSGRSFVVLGAGVVAACLVAALLALGLALVGRLALRFGGVRVAPWAPAVFAAIAAVWPSWAVGRSLTGGDWIARQSWAPALRLSLAIVGPIFALGVVRAGMGLRDRAGRGTALAAAAAAVALTLADALVLPGLYAPLHLVLTASTVAAALTAASLALRGRTWPRAVTWSGVAACWLALVPLSLLDGTTRVDLMLASPRAAALLPLVTRAPPTGFLRQELEAMGRSSPPPEAPRGLLGAHPEWNVILIVVDSLRADAITGIRSDGFAKKRDAPFFNRWIQSAYRFHDAYAQASQTRHSMPALFRSAEPYEDPTTVGVPLPVHMAALGRRPIAVVPLYFLEPAAAESQRLLDGFDDIAVYERTAQEDLVPRARPLLEANRDRPFFAWIHFFAPHAPFYFGHPSTPSEGSPRRRYLRAVRWLDGELAKLDAILRELHLYDDTVVVLTADHGEALGEHGQASHGHTVFGPEIRVPLAIRVPGRAGGDVAPLVGNIDVLPTLFELIGAPLDPQHRGRSLVPLMADPEREWRDPHYIRSGDGKVHGIVTEEHKLVWDTRAGSFYRFDLRADPEEVHNRFDPSSPVDRDLVSQLVRANPGLMRRELRDRAVQDLLTRRLREVDAATPLGDLELLIRLVALDPSTPHLEAGRRIFDVSRADGTKLLVLRHLDEHDGAALGRRLQQHLARLAGSRRELDLVTALARQRQGSFKPDWVARRLDALAATDDGVRRRAWLELVLPWRKPARTFGPPLAKILARATDPSELALALQNVAALTAGPGLPEALEPLVLARLEHAELPVRIAACQAAARVKGPTLEPALRRRIGKGGLDMRERQALLHAIAAVEGRRATALLVELGADPVLTLDAVKALHASRDPAALPFLRGVAETAFTWYTRREAQRAIDALSRSGGRERARERP